jgi:nucleoside-diphosphate-sugar epimerase
MSKAILITGGFGFLGLQLARELITQDNKIVIFDLKSPDSLLQRGNSNVVHVCGDIWGEKGNLYEQHGGICEQCDEACDEWGWKVLYSLEDTVKDFMQAFTGDKGK